MTYETKIDNLKQNCQCRLCVERDEVVNKLLSKDDEQVRTRHDWVGKLIHKEKYKRLKFDHASKWYNNWPKSVLENRTHKIL